MKSGPFHKDLYAIPFSKSFSRMGFNAFFPLGVWMCNTLSSNERNVDGCYGIEVIALNKS